MLIGIDLGTTATQIAVIQTDEEPCLLPARSPLSTNSLADLMRDLIQLHHQLQPAFPEQTPLPVAIAIPPEATNQERFMRLEAFRQAGFQVRYLILENAAIAREYQETHTPPKQKNHLAIFRLQQHNLQLSVISLMRADRPLLAYTSTPLLSGQQLDEILQQQLLQQAGAPLLPPAAQAALLSVCHTQRHSIHARSKRIMIDSPEINQWLGKISLPCEVYYQACTPLIQQGIALLDQMLQRVHVQYPELGANQGLAGIYLTGDSSELPIISRLLKNTYQRSLHKAEHPATTLASGLALFALEDPLLTTPPTAKSYLHDYFGVWREAEQGQTVAFDLIFGPQTRLPAPDEPPLVVKRFYQPVHNIGHFRYLQCSQMSDHFEPGGQLALWEPIVFPFDSTLNMATTDWQNLTVQRYDNPLEYWIEEHYECDAAGRITVVLRHPALHYQCQYSHPSPIA